MARYSKPPASAGLLWLAAGVLVLVAAAVWACLYLRRPPAGEWLVQATREYLLAAVSGEFHKCFGYEDVAGKAPYARYDQAMRRHYLVEQPARQAGKIEAGLEELSTMSAVTFYRLELRDMDKGVSSFQEGRMRWRLSNGTWKRLPDAFLVAALALADAYEDEELVP